MATQWRALIAYRTALVQRRTAIKNHVRAILDREGLRHPGGFSGWTRRGVAALAARAVPLERAVPEELWRGMLHLELTAFEQVEAIIRDAEAKLTVLAEADERVARLRTIPGVGPRLAEVAEVVVAVLDDPKRFKNAKQVGAYAGLVPKQYESGMSKRQGRITGAGNTLLRTMLIEVAWLARRYNSWAAGVFDRACRGSTSRRKVAIVALARRLLVVCWAMLGDAARRHRLVAAGSESGAGIGDNRGGGREPARTKTKEQA